MKKLKRTSKSHQNLPALTAWRLYSSPSTYQSESEKQSKQVTDHNKLDWTEWRMNSNTRTHKFTTELNPSAARKNPLWSKRTTKNWTWSLITTQDGDFPLEHWQKKPNLVIYNSKHWSKCMKKKRHKLDHKQDHKKSSF